MIRNFLALAALTFSAMAFGSGLEKPAGDMMFENRISPFPSGAFFGGSGPSPDPGGANDIAKALSPYLTLEGDLGFMEISELFAVRSVEISVKLADATTIKQVFPFSGKESTDAVRSRLQHAVETAKSSATATSLASCVTGNFWADGQSWGFSACYTLDHDGTWGQKSYEHTPLSRAAPAPV